MLRDRIFFHFISYWANRSKPSAKDLRDVAELRLNERHGLAVGSR